MKYLCLACDTEFTEEEGQYSNGWLVCPSCDYDELLEIEINNLVGAVGE